MCWVGLAVGSPFCCIYRIYLSHPVAVSDVFYEFFIWTTPVHCVNVADATNWNMQKMIMTKPKMELSLHLMLSMKRCWISIRQIPVRHRRHRTCTILSYIIRTQKIIENWILMMENRIESCCVRRTCVWVYGLNDLSGRLTAHNDIFHHVIAHNSLIRNRVCEPIRRHIPYFRSPFVCGAQTTNGCRARLCAYRV